MSDRKEHHFCFAYKGQRMRITPFETLHFINVQGTSTLDGYQFVRISLHRKNGRRANTILNVIHEYNALSGTEPITPEKITPQLITCFKATQSSEEDNPILLRIEADRRSSARYWCWNAAQEQPTANKKPLKKGTFAGLEGLVRELNLDPSVLCMQSAYDSIANSYFQVHPFHPSPFVCASHSTRQVNGKVLKNSGSFSAQDKDFIMAELKRHFDRERMFIVAPNTHPELNDAAKALTQTDLMDDLKFKDEASSSTGRNGLVLEYFERMMPLWHGSDTQIVALKDILAEFNRKNEGMYRRACVIPFMRPFIDAGAVEIVDTHTVRVHVGRVESSLQK